jgi:hypothetical protein
LFAADLQFAQMSLFQRRMTFPSKRTSATVSIDSKTNSICVCANIYAVNENLTTPSELCSTNPFLSGLSTRRIWIRNLPRSHQIQMCTTRNVSRPRTTIICRRGSRIGRKIRRNGGSTTRKTREEKWCVCCTVRASKSSLPSQQNPVVKTLARRKPRMGITTRMSSFKDHQ